MRCNSCRSSVGSRLLGGVSGLLILMLTWGASPAPLAAQQTALSTPKSSATDPYVTYEPYACAAAVNRAWQVLRRKQDDTLQFAPPPDTVPTVIQTVARQCTAHFSIPAVDTQQLRALYATYAVVNDSVHMHAVAARMLAQAHTPAERANALLSMGNGYSLFTFPLYRRFLTLLAQIDAIPGPASAAARVQMHFNLGVFYALFMATEDSAAIANFRAALAAGNDLDAADRTALGGMLQNVSGLLQLIAQMDNDSTPRGPAPSLHGESLLGGTGPWPVPGKITLIVFQMATTRQSIAAFRRLHARYGDTLAIVFAGKTLGYFKMQGPLTEPAEAQLLKAYYGKDLDVPGAVVLEHTTFTTRADGRVIPQPTANEIAYPQTTIVLVDGKGRLRATYGTWAPPFEVRLERSINRMLGER